MSLLINEVYHKKLNIFLHFRQYIILYITKTLIIIINMYILQKNVLLNTNLYILNQLAMINVRRLL